MKSFEDLFSFLKYELIELSLKNCNQNISFLLPIPQNEIIS